MPTLVNVADWDVLVLPMSWSGKVSVVVLREKPGAGAGGGSAAVLPPPPQDMEHKAIARQAAVRITNFTRSHRSALARMMNASRARVLLTPMEVLSYVHAAFRMPRAHLRVPLPCTRVHGTEVLHEHLLFRYYNSGSNGRNTTRMVGRNRVMHSHFVRKAEKGALPAQAP